MYIFDILFASLPNIDDVTLARAKKGDEQAIADLLAFYEKKVYNIALKTLQNSDDAYDAAQESLIKIYRGVAGFRGGCAFSSWVYRLTVNTCLDMLRRHKNCDISADGAAEELGLQIPDDALDSDPEGVLYNTELGRTILTAINSLSDDYRTAVMLCDVEGLTYDEIAETLRVSVGTVKSRIFRGREKLRGMLAGITENN